MRHSAARTGRQFAGTDCQTAGLEADLESPETSKACRPTHRVPVRLAAQETTLMFLLDLILPSRHKARWNSLVDQVAGASVDAVCRRVELRAGVMTPAEARGYIRVRSTTIVQQKADYALAHRPAALVARRETLVDEAREEVVRRVMGRIRTPVAAIVRSRRAA